MIQFLLHIISVVITAFLIGFILVWIQRKFSKEPQYKITYEFMVFTLKLVSYSSDKEAIFQAEEKWKELRALGAEGWEIVGVGDSTFSGKEIFLQRQTIHAS